MKRIVIDTNVLISGMFWEGNYSSKIITNWKEEKIIIISSSEIIQEFQNTLRNFKIKLPKEIIDEWVNLFF